MSYNIYHIIEIKCIINDINYDDYSLDILHRSDRFEYKEIL